MIIGIIALVLGISVAIVYAVMLAWNYVMVSTFGLPVLTFWKTWLLMWLVGIFAGMFGRKKN